MPKRPCLDCGQLSAGPRCPAHTQARQRARDQARGSTTSRGLGWAHRQQRTGLLEADQTGACPGCGEAYTPDNPATAEHSTARSRGGTEADRLLCRRCNSAAGGRLGRANRTSRAR